MRLPRRFMLFRRAQLSFRFPPDAISEYATRRAAPPGVGGAACDPPDKTSFKLSVQRPGIFRAVFRARRGTLDEAGRKSNLPEGEKLFTLLPYSDCFGFPRFFPGFSRVLPGHEVRTTFMHVIICGAGEVGHAVAQYLSQENNIDISVIDRSPELVEHLNQTLDVRGIVGDCCDPGILEKAGLENADVLLVLTGSNEVNMVCCQLADSFFSVNCKIARLKRGAAFDRAWDKKITESFVKADTVLTFENMVAHAIADRLERQGVLDSETFLDKAVRFIGVRCTENCPLLSTPLKQLTNLFPNLSIRILALERDGQGKIPNASDFLLLGDTVWFVVKTEQIVRALEAFGIESEDRIHQVGIVGGGEVGSHLAFELLRRARDDEGSFTSGLNLTFIERDGGRAQLLASQLEAQTILQGNVMDADTLRQLSPDKFYAWVSVTNQEETNILSSLMMKASGCSWVLALIAEPLASTGPVQSGGGCSPFAARGLALGDFAAHTPGQSPQGSTAFVGFRGDFGNRAPQDERDLGYASAAGQISARRPSRGYPARYRDLFASWRCRPPGWRQNCGDLSAFQPAQTRATHCDKVRVFLISPPLPSPPEVFSRTFYRCTKLLFSTGVMGF